MDSGCASEGAATLWILALQQVAFASAGAKHFATGGNLEPLGRGLFGLNAFRTSHSSINFLQKSAQYRFPRYLNQAVFSRFQRSPGPNRRRGAWGGEAIEAVHSRPARLPHRCRTN